jgi:hypothetical protein
MIHFQEKPMRFAHALRPIAVALVLAALIPAHASAVGENGFAFLKLGVGARAMGMGGAYVAEVNDPTAVYWNPAGLAALQTTQITFMHNEWIQDFRQDFACVATPAFRNRGGGLALGLSTFYSSEFEKRTDTGLLIGHFGFNDILATGSAAFPLARGLTGGLSAKYVREMIDQESASSIAGDLGVRYQLPRTAVTLAGALQNVGTKATFITESFKLPTTVRMGAAYALGIPAWNGQTHLSAEYRHASGDGSRVQVGGEFVYRQVAALRAGLKLGYDEEKLSFGLGLNRDRFSFDYAIVPLSSDLGTTHFFSLTARL